MTGSGNFKEVISDDHMGGFLWWGGGGGQGFVCSSKGPEENGDPQKDLKEGRHDEVCTFLKTGWLQGVRLGYRWRR